MNTLKNTIKRSLRHKGIKPLSGCEFTAAGANALNAGLREGVKDRIHNPLQNNNLLFEYASIVISHKKSSFHGFGEHMMDVAGGHGNVPASIAGEPG